MIDFGELLGGTGVWWGQAAAEPRPLVDALLEPGRKRGPLRLFTGLSWNDTLTSVLGDDDEMISYGGLGALRKLGDRLQVVPCHYGAMPRLFAEGHLPADIGLIQVSPPDDDGRCSLGIGSDYMADAAAVTPRLFAEINKQMPAVPGAPSLPLERFAGMVETDRRLANETVREPEDADRRIAAGIAGLIDDGDTLQIGVGAIGAAVLEALVGHRDLGVHTGMVTDGVMRLIDAGVITNAAKPIDRGFCVAGTALGSTELYDRSTELPFRFAATSYTHAPQVLSQISNLVAVNFAIEVDLTGQVGAELSRGNYLGAVGGQVDFARAASYTGKRSVVALRAAVRGRSSIKFVLEEGAVSTGRADVDCVVTEYGVAHLRGQPLAERRRRLIGVAAPEFRDDLARKVAEARNS
ncbi:acetyl-CoA hydrolase/transferase family protein [Gordonia sp. MP11Mi]|uniref:Butyrate:acetyl-CoA coenzyme A-transferase n=1 Tax=Gordonia sp. MP11Mi TaxID=3022769 RepID=A0AA97CXT3_9ACTN